MLSMVSAVRNLDAKIEILKKSEGIWNVEANLKFLGLNELQMSQRTKTNWTQQKTGATDFAMTKFLSYKESCWKEYKKKGIGRKDKPQCWLVVSRCKRKTFVKVLITEDGIWGKTRLETGQWTCWKDPISINDTVTGLLDRYGVESCRLHYIKKFISDLFN